jgi:hypothetical protein
MANTAGARVRTVEANLIGQEARPEHSNALFSNSHRLRRVDRKDDNASSVEY